MENFASFAKNFVSSYFSKDLVFSSYSGVKVAKRNFGTTAENFSQIKFQKKSVFSLQQYCLET